MSFIDSIKSFIGFETDDDSYDDEYYDEEDEVTNTDGMDDDDDDRPRRNRFAKKTAPKVVPINPGTSSRVRIMKPQEFNDARTISDEIKSGRLVIFNVIELDASVARRVVDFVSGAAYGINGVIRRVSEGIFVAAPRNINITGENLKEQAKNSFDWNLE